MDVRVWDITSFGGKNEWRGGKGKGSPGGGFGGGGGEAFESKYRASKEIIVSYSAYLVKIQSCGVKDGRRGGTHRQNGESERARGGGLRRKSRGC